MIKNYYIEFQNKDIKRLTALEAKMVLKAINDKKKVFVIDGQAYPLRYNFVGRISRDQERYLLENAGVIELNAPEHVLTQAMENFSIENIKSNQKKLNGSK